MEGGPGFGLLAIIPWLIEGLKGSKYVKVDKGMFGLGMFCGLVVGLVGDVFLLLICNYLGLNCFTIQISPEILWSDLVHLTWQAVMLCSFHTLFWTYTIGVFMGCNPSENKNDVSTNTVAIPFIVILALELISLLLLI